MPDAPVSPIATADATDLATHAVRVAGALDRARTGLVDREVLADVVVLCAVAGEHALVVGPPGTAKSEAIRRVARELGGSYFEYLVGRFTEPNELFGPIDLQSLREGVVRVETAGMLPEADVAFLDEVFLGSTAILNTLLGLLNERVYRRGSTVVRSPLRVCVGACNTLPEDPALAAFADRFLVRVFVDQVSDDRLEELLETGWAGDRARAAGDVAVAEPSLRPSLDALAAAVPTVDVAAVGATLGSAVRRLRGAGVVLSDRRVVRAQRLVAAAAVLDGRTVATDADLWVLPLIAPTADGQALATDLLGDLMAVASSRAVPHAAEALSLGRQARADRMVDASGVLLSALPEGALDRDDRLRVEALLREMDATFVADARPGALAAARDVLTQRLEPAALP